MGDRENAYEDARKLLAEHRQNLVNGLMYVKENGVIQLENIQYFDAGSQIKETIVGIIAGMSSTIVENRNLPIIAFAKTDGGVKVSARGTQDLIRRGVNLSEAMSTVSAEVGGAGGGHDIAAGATIPENAKEEFARKLDFFHRGTASTKSEFRIRGCSEKSNSANRIPQKAIRSWYSFVTKLEYKLSWFYHSYLTSAERREEPGDLLSKEKDELGSPSLQWRVVHGLHQIFLY